MKYIDPRAQFEGRKVVHPSQRQHHVTPITAPLYVVTAVTNPFRYYARTKLYQAFEKYVADSGAILYTVELALRDRHFEITDYANPRHIQLRSPSVLWHKENLLNVAMRRLPADAEYIAWIDADVTFSRPDWVEETLHQLQLYKIVQMWTHSIDLGPNQELIAQCTSLFSSYLKDRHILQPLDRKKPADLDETGAQRELASTSLPQVKGNHAYDMAMAANKPLSNEGKGLMHTGYAWAARRSFLSDVGGLGDIGVLGSGDRHMAYAILGAVDRSFPTGIHPHYKNYWLRWQAAALKSARMEVGAVPATLTHQWHGSKQNRRYQDRWKVLVGDQFDPLADIKYDFQGVLEFTGSNTRLRDDVKNYFAVRNEDSIDL
jgi:hypothetical protein